MSAALENSATTHGLHASALAGLRILDMTNVVMGPYATQILADYGADVVKIESPSGDTTRQIPPMRHADMGCLFLHLNRNKRSVVLDLKVPECVEAFVAMASQSDVLICNVRPAALARLGITYEDLSARNPRLIWISLVGFGSDGPYAGRPAYEDLLQGLTGMPAMLVQAGSEQPHYVPLSFNDRVVGLHAAIALLSAVHWRERSGRGQFIEVPMFETMTQFTIGDHMGGQTFEPPEGPMGYQRTLTKERRPYATLDGFICLVVYTDKHWRSFFEAIGQPQRFDTDERVQSLRSRTTHAGALYAELAEIMRTRSTADWLELMNRADIPAAPMLTLDSVVTDPHLEAVGMFQLVEHPTEGVVRQLRPPTQWSESPPTVRLPAPSLGQHTAEVLREAGVDPAQIDQIVARLAQRGAAKPRHGS
ncbi:CoA transferase [uncultured Azohydromonas sp.]|jgi:Predicted acyl-CoA transferases/carnitine dehydratase|uniref:CaiB/BaiF CoA transferase family protein n=1 Tax=uncultured Azohydromonas sp. TaxID=487342 RepID=UPI00260E72E2|nr:CoA transferase [uncultured Azohydromonas sp.]